jgi:translation elongation factor EF-Ts
MSINLEQIDELRKRANVSYEDAKNALEQNAGNLIEALVYLEKQNKIKPEENASSENQFFKKVKKLIKKGNETKLIVKKDDTVVLNICVTLAIITTVVATPLVVAALIFALATNHKIRIQKKNSEDSQVNKIFDKISVAVNKVTTKITEEMKTE